MNGNQEQTMQPMQPPLSATMPDTQYFEIESAAVGARFAIWVTTPVRYATEPSSSYPAIFVPDGNLVAPLTTPVSHELREDPIHPIVPFVQVSVGYAGKDAADMLRVRNRDLLPPGEPVNPALIAAIDRVVAAGTLTVEQGGRHKASLYNTRADAFLSFLTDELYPQIAKRYRIDAESSGLFGYSYGGLFACYVAFQRPPAFTRIGAGSPGMLTPESVVFQMLEQHLRDGVDHSGRHLHMTVNELEITVPTVYQMLGSSFSRFVTTIGATPLKGLLFTSHIHPFESHATGIAASWNSFLRTCYSAT